MQHNDMQGSRSATAAPHRSCRNKAGAMPVVKSECFVRGPSDSTLHSGSRKLHRTGTAAPHRSCRNKARAMVCVFLSVVKVIPHSIRAITNYIARRSESC